MLHKKVKLLLLGFVFFLAVVMICLQLRVSSTKKSRLVSSHSDGDQLVLPNLNILRYPSSKQLSWLAPEVHRDARNQGQQLRNVDDDDDDDGFIVGGSPIHSRDLRYYTINDDLVQEMSLSWILLDLGLEVRLNCRKGRNVEVSKEDALLVVCLNSTHLTKVAMAKKLNRFEAKLLVLTSIFNKLGGNGTAIMLKGKRAGELSMRFDELVISKLAPLIASRLREKGGGIKLGYHPKMEPVKTNNHSHTNVQVSPVTHSPDFEKELDLSFLHRAGQVEHEDEEEQENASIAPTAMRPSPTQWRSQKKNLQQPQKSRRAPESEENNRKNGILLPEGYHKEIKGHRGMEGQYKPRFIGDRSISRKSHQTQPLYISPSLMKLQGYRFMSHKSLLERGFHANYTFKSPKLMHAMQYLKAEMARVGVKQRDVAKHSLDPNLLKRAEFQQGQVKKFCSKYSSSMYLPGDVNQLDVLFKHLLYDDKRRLVFCYVPKNGCSNMKRTFLVLNGYLPESEAQVYARPPESLLSKVNSFRGLSREGALYRLNNYYKFAILRNPLERLLSAYRNKLEKPLNYTLVKKFPDRLKAYILTMTNRELIEKWSKEKNFSRDIHPSFSDTLQFMTKFDLSSYNEHFLPFLELCQPCAINYDAFLNLKTLPYDIFAILEYLGIPNTFYPPPAKSENTRALMSGYYKRVPSAVKNRVFKRLGRDIRFYYELHPEEKGMHVNL